MGDKKTNKGSAAKVLEAMSEVGKWDLDVAEKIAVSLAVTCLKQRWGCRKL